MSLRVLQMLASPLASGLKVAHALQAGYQSPVGISVYELNYQVNKVKLFGGGSFRVMSRWSDTQWRSSAYRTSCSGLRCDEKATCTFT